MQEGGWGGVGGWGVGRGVFVLMPTTFFATAVLTMARPEAPGAHRPLHPSAVNPRVLIYLYSFVWRSQLKIGCDFRKQLGKVC